jgi:hypothetical protein
MKAYGEVDVQIHVFLISALVGGVRSPSRPGCFIPGERALGTHRIGRWVDPRAGLDDVEKRKSSNSDPSVVQPVASRYTDCAIPVPILLSTYTLYRHPKIQVTNSRPIAPIQRSTNGSVHKSRGGKNYMER